ncbi:hypothetical protein B0H19DRAFT_1377039 [Mycena capillaripes]|nr:hypothetical protein B0H19DRAFT_1377039 [Mycena capillaripes]
MYSFSATSLLAVLATSVLTTAAPLQWARANNNANANANANDLAQFAVACSTVGIAGNLTFQTIGLLSKIKTNDKDIAGQLEAINSTLTTAFNSGETARPVCEAPDPNNLASQFVTACDAINIAGELTGTTITLLNQIETDDQTLAGQVDVLKATMNGVNTAGQVANGVCAGIDTNSGDVNNANGNNANNNNNNNANGNNNANNNSANKNNAINNAKSSSSSVTSKATQTQGSAAQKTQSK